MGTYHEVCVQQPDFSLALMTAETCTTSTHSQAVSRQLFPNISSV